MQPIKKLHWQCRRGMKELDILFEYYLYNHYETATDAEQTAFETLINCQDPIILDYLFGRSQPNTATISPTETQPDETQPAEVKKIIQLMQAFHQDLIKKQLPKDSRD
ncbi:FAD assembly factor SdhE [Ostreibacterium oceani]|uniref:FAD assembly factor SdhE n=1 Tax=Ostreibacterium oceani TaxID=2654998 RepID=A0A6N7EWE4_9GAMM|nr:succinate dehydrogenase assembly factor 2 [Ostreibacterium oceani]MPV86871.1 hypothetical protein [Ostreibacterium oceani]